MPVVQKQSDSRQQTTRPTLAEARARAYELVHRVHIDGATFRTDIAAL